MGIFRVHSIAICRSVALQVAEDEYVYYLVCVRVLFSCLLSLGKIKIQDILACGFLDDLLEVSRVLTTVT